MNKIYTIAVSASMLLSSAVALAQQSIPYVHDFDSENSLSGFTVIDVNQDGDQWRYSAADHALKCGYGDFASANDWLISPALSLKAGTTYKVTYNVKAYNNNGETFGICLGQGTTAAAMTTTIMPQTEQTIVNGNFMAVSHEFTVAADGNYNLGLHYTTASLFFGGSMFVSSMSVEDAANAAVSVAPAAPTLTVTVNSEKAPYSVSIKVRTPGLDTNGNPLAGLLKCEVKRDDNVIFYVDGPMLNSNVRTTDENVPEGKHVYSACVYGLDGTVSESATEEVIFGQVPDAAPEAVEGVVAVFDPATLQSTITWTAPTLSQDGVELHSAVTYNIRRKGSYDPIATGVSGTSYVDNVELDAQVASAYYITAVNGSGSSREVKSNDLIIGRPSELPFIESAPGGNLSNAWLITRSGTSRWGASDMGSIAYDGDRGYITFCPFEDNDSSSIASGHIHLAEAFNPVLRFHYFYVMPNDDDFNVTLSVDGGEPFRIWNFDYESIGNTERWVEVEIPIFEVAPGAKYIQVSFNARLAVATQPILYLDDISIFDKRERDLSVSLVKAPRDLKPGEPRNVILRLDNLGGVDLASGEAVVKALVNDKCIAEAKSPKIKAGKRIDLSLDGLTLDVFETAREVALSFVVELEGDEQPDNNVIAPITVAVKPVYVAAPVNAKVSGTQLTWTAPETVTVQCTTVTESFEDAPSFTIDDFDEWAMYDALNTSVYGLETAEGSIPFPNTMQPQAWTVFDYTYDPAFYTSVQPRTGNKAMAAFAHGGVTENSWLISPELSGQEQTISFYAKAISSQYTEKLCISYLTSSSIIFKNFDDLPDSETILTPNWREYSFELPEDTRYFAIRAISKDALCLMVDDVTYIPEALGQPCTEVLGYNVYCDGVKINPVLVNALAYTVPEVDHTYHVTAVYKSGESLASAPAEVVAEGIQTIQADSIDAPVYNLSGQRISGPAKGLVVIVEGKKVKR